MKALLLIVILAAGFATQAAAQSAEDLFQQALRVERVSGNTEAAIELYAQVVTDYPTERAVVVRALLQMGKAYEVLGRDGAREAYSRIVAEYGDFPSVAGEAAERIAAFARLEAPAMVKTHEPGSLELITLDPQPASIVAGAAMSPDGKFIARGAEGGLVLQHLESGSIDSLSEIQELCGWSYTARFSPNGNQIAFGCYTGGPDDERPWGVAVFDRDSREAKLVFNAAGYFGECSYWLSVLDWSTDGSEILAAVQYCGESDEGELLLLPVAGGTPTVLERDFQETGFWYPQACLLQDGRFMFGAYGGDHASIHRLDTTSSERAVVLSDDLVEIALYDCLPASETLIYSRKQAAGQQVLFATTVQPDGALGTPRFLATIPARTVPIPGAKNGAVHFGERNPERFVAVADVDPERGRAVSNFRKIDFNAHNFPEPRWSPNGSQFIVTDRWMATIAGFDGAEPTRWDAPFHAEEEGDPEVRRWLGLMLWSPDGSQLISSYPVGGFRTHYKGTEVFDRDSGEVIDQVPNLAAVAWLPDATGFYYVAHSESSRCLSTYSFATQATAETFCVDGEPASELQVNRWRWWWSPGWSLSPDGSTFAYWGREQSPEGQDSPLYLLDTATWEMEHIGAVVIRGRTPQISWSGDSRLLFNFARITQAPETTTRAYNLDRGQWEDWSLSGLGDLTARTIAFHPSGEKVALSGIGPELTGLNLWVLHQPPGLLESN